MLKRDKVIKYKEWVRAGRPRDNDNVLWQEYKASKKVFSKEIRRVSRTYDEEQVAKTVNSIEVDRNIFWRFLKRCRNSRGSKTLAIRNEAGKVLYDIEGVLDVWKTHFQKLCLPKDCDSYDKEHFDMVNEAVRVLNATDDGDEFLKIPMTEAEVGKAISKLHTGKACGYDNVSAEHLKYAGQQMVEVLTILFNRLIAMEYIPVNFRCGIQVPLYKGKNTCSLSVENYRGITLLTTLNKLFETLLWGRMEKWWWNSGIVSRFQGACRKGQSCVHTALLLQETVSDALDAGRRVFVSYFDVSKAFDSVWTNGLFYQLHQNGVQGKIWRLMYRAYIGFNCRVRIGDSMSQWYPMTVGIHQGGILSLIKYISFINSLLEEIEASKLGCSVSGIPSTPAGYADDLATASLSKWQSDKVHNIVHGHSKRWRYKLNAKKSAVLVYGEGKAENHRNAKFREFSLGPEKVKERTAYDHVGVRACIERGNEDRVNDKISNGRRALNAAAGLGIRRKGLNMASCNLIFWMVIVPIITFGSEIWVLSDKDYHNLLAFQRFAGRRFQRLPYKSPNGSSFAAMGWMRITTYIYIKKLLFIRTVLKMGPGNVIYDIFKKRYEKYERDFAKSADNHALSPVFDMLNTCKKFGVYGRIKGYLDGSAILAGKTSWKKYVWERAWVYEDMFWYSTKAIYKENKLLDKVNGVGKFSVWWWISDIWPNMIGMCETMVKIICRTSKLKVDDYSLKGGTHSLKACDKCEMYAVEDIFHILMQCPFFQNDMKELYAEIRLVTPNLLEEMDKDNSTAIYHLLGKPFENAPWEEQVKMWCVSGRRISMMYYKLVKGRCGIG